LRSIDLGLEVEDAVLQVGDYLLRFEIARSLKNASDHFGCLPKGGDGGDGCCELGNYTLWKIILLSRGFIGINIVQQTDSTRRIVGRFHPRAQTEGLGTCPVQSAIPLRREVAGILQRLLPPVTAKQSFPRQSA
jgi:hypothetical protein